MNISPFHLKFFLSLITILWILPSNIFAQCGETIPISCGTSFTGEYCYGNDDDCVISFCPDDTTGVITLTVNTGAVEVSYDQFSIYFGSTATGNPDIVLTGTITGNSITSSEPDSCLTIQIVSDFAGSCETGEINPNIEYTVSCEIECLFDFDFLVSNDEVCPMETVSFEVADSLENATYSWDFGDGNTANGLIVEHIFEASGGYLVVLTKTINGCVRTTERFIKVAPIPEILVETQGEWINEAIPSVCPEDSIIITANVFAGNIWIPTPMLLDTSVVIDSFHWGAMSGGVSIEIGNPFEFIQEDSQIEFCLEMTHEWFTDSEIIVESPNGIEITLLEYQDWTLGNINIAGLYCFSMEAEQTMLGSIDSLTGTILADGNYLPYESFDDLIGSPIQGTWTFQFNDYFPVIDNGILTNISMYIDNVGVNVDSIVVNIADVSIYGSTEMDWTTIDSTYQYIGATPEEAGVYTYTISVTDDFGCVYEENIDIEVLPYSNEICPPECPLFATDTLAFEVCTDELFELPTGTVIKVDTSMIFPDISIGLLNNNGCDSLITIVINALTNDSCLHTSLNDFIIEGENILSISPNPTNEKTTLTIDLLENSMVSISIYDIAGKRIQTIVDKEKVDAGKQTFLVETNGYTQGLYFVHLQVNNEFVVKKIIVE